MRRTAAGQPHCVLNGSFSVRRTRRNASLRTLDPLIGQVSNVLETRLPVAICVERQFHALG